MAYLDDVIIYSKTKDGHVNYVKRVLELLKEADSSLNRKKCKFGKSEMMTLGSVISEGKVVLDPAKVEAIESYTIPQTVRELRSFWVYSTIVEDKLWLMRTF